MLRNAVGGMSNFPEKNVTNVYYSKLLALHEGVSGCQFSRKSVI